MLSLAPETETFPHGRSAGSRRLSNYVWKMSWNFDKEKKEERYWACWAMLSKTKAAYTAWCLLSSNCSFLTKILALRCKHSVIGLWITFCCWWCNYTYVQFKLRHILSSNLVFSVYHAWSLTRVNPLYCNSRKCSRSFSHFPPPREISWLSAEIWPEKIQNPPATNSLYPHSSYTTKLSLLPSIVFIAVAAPVRGNNNALFYTLLLCPIKLLLTNCNCTYTTLSYNRTNFMAHRRVVVVVSLFPKKNAENEQQQKLKGVVLV